jgi:hypothetical protein
MPPRAGLRLVEPSRPDRLGTLRPVRELHGWTGLLVIGANVLALGWGASYVGRKRLPARVYTHVLAGAQALVIAQVALGLLLLSDDVRTADRLHYVYGTLALVAVLAPWFYAPPEPARRLLWFVVASLVAAALAVRAYTTAG